MPPQYYVQIHGCVVSLKSKGSGTGVLRRLLVQPLFIELWNMVSDGLFDTNLWVRLTPTEKQFLMMLAHKLKLDNRQLHSANNNEATGSIERLKLLEGSIAAGNISKEILDEAHTIIDDLSNRSMLHKRTANALKKRLASAYKATHESIETIQSLRKRR